MLFTYVASQSFSPPDISNLALWLDASDSSTITQSGGSVSLWADKSGNGYNASQATGASQPQTGVSTINGNNALTFNGSSSFFSVAPALRNIIRNSPETTALVYRTNAVSNQIQFAMNIGGTSVKTMRVQNSATYSASGSGPALAVSVTIDTNAHIAGFRRNGVNRMTYHDAATATDTNGVDSNYDNAIYVGRGATGNYHSGELAEIILYNKALSDAEKLQLDTYLKSKWGTP